MDRRAYRTASRSLGGRGAGKRDRRTTGCVASCGLRKISRLRRLASNVRQAKTRQSNAALSESAASDDGFLHGWPPPALRRRGKRGDQSDSPHAKVKARGKQLLELTNNCCRWPLGKP